MKLDAITLYYEGWIEINITKDSAWLVHHDGHVPAEQKPLPFTLVPFISKLCEQVGWKPTIRIKQ